MTTKIDEGQSDLKPQQIAEMAVITAEPNRLNGPGSRESKPAPGVSDTLTGSDRYLIDCGIAQSMLTTSDWRPIPMTGLDTKRIVCNVLAMALLANESSGDIRFDWREEHHLFGLIKKTVLTATRMARSQWPALSLEKTVARKLEFGRTDSISDIIYDWIGSDSESPWQEALRSLFAKLADRRILETRDCGRTVLWLFKERWIEFRLPQATAEALASDKPALQRLLLPLEPRRQLAASMREGIEHGFSRRTIETD